jgi:hypothetical protein
VQAWHFALLYARCSLYLYLLRVAQGVVLWGVGRHLFSCCWQCNEAATSALLLLLLLLLRWNVQNEARTVARHRHCCCCCP